MCAPQAKFDHSPLFGRETNAGGFRCDKCLKIDDIQQRSLKKLALQQWSGDSKQRLVREYNTSFGNRVHITGKLEPIEIIQKFVLKKWLLIRTGKLGKIVEVIGLKFKVLKVINRVAKSARDCVSAVEGWQPEKGVEDGLIFQHLFFPIAIRHCELVEVGKESGRNAIFLGHTRMRLSQAVHFERNDIIVLYGRYTSILSPK